MELSEVFVQLGDDTFGQLLHSISMGKLKTYQLFERLKTRAHLGKLNTENLRRAGPRLMERLRNRDADLATDLSQCILISHFDMIVDVLNYLKIPHEDGFFVKDVDAKAFLTEGWKERVFQEFQGKYPPALLLFYINHLALEVANEESVYVPAA
jgi:hypothetical protein